MLHKFDAQKERNEASLDISMLNLASGLAFQRVLCSVSLHFVRDRIDRFHFPLIQTKRNKCRTHLLRTSTGACVIFFFFFLPLYDSVWYLNPNTKRETENTEITNKQKKNPFFPWRTNYQNKTDWKPKTSTEYIIGSRRITIPGPKRVSRLRVGKWSKPSG